ncbi:MAG: MaoC family dehydratase N-terminal domain-containing protein [Sulfitobacter sp.]
MDQINLQAWIERSDLGEGQVSQQQANMVHAVLGAPGQPAPQHGEIMPHLWHWYAFPPTAGMDELGEDGHPRLGNFMPPVRLNRRMWAGGNIEFIKPLHVGEPLRRRTTIADISEKTGAAGDIVVVRLDHEIHGAQGLAVVERQDVVYLQIPDSFVPPKKTPGPQSPAFRVAQQIGTPLLFRYSAITFNAHRIHYDLPYTQSVEHYPDLVVHGPLQAQLLMNMATRERGAAPKLFAYRGVHPLFASDAVELCAVKKTTSEWALSTVANEGHQTMQANAMWEI